MNNSCFVGIDLGKKTFDASIITADRQELSHASFENTTEGMNNLLKWVKSSGVILAETLFCAENMGVYATSLCLASVEHSFKLALACPLSIKKSSGIQRGKSDRIDAKRIACYAATRWQELELYHLPEVTITRLKALLLLREQAVKNRLAHERLLDTIVGMSQLADLREQREFLENKIADEKRDIKEIEKKLLEVSAENPLVENNFKLLTSITGIGKLNAILMICLTGNFQRFTDQRKFACYCGVAPFEYTSGTSIRGKTRTSPLANRKMKVMLTSAALAAISFDPWLKNYYHRKIKEGKHKASVINAVRAKLIARCFAVIRRQVPFISLMA